jgi:hypothetical protein
MDAVAQAHDEFDVAGLAHDGLGDGGDRWARAAAYCRAALHM